MDEMLSRLIAFPPSPEPGSPVTHELYDKQARSLVSFLEKTNQSKLIASEDSLLDYLQPSLQSLSYLYVLSAHIDAAISPGKHVSHNIPQAILPEGLLWPRIVVLLNEFDPVQVRYAGHLFNRVIEIVVSGAEQTGNAIPAIQLLYTVILRLDPSSSTLTSTHFHFIRLCLAMRMFSEGAAILDRHIYHIPATTDKASAQRSYQYLCDEHESSAVYLTPSTGLTNRLECRDYLEYYLYGGMIYMGLRLWEKALYFFEVVLVAPTANTASMVMVEAYKKWLLVGLLIAGKPPAYPQAANPTAMRSIKAIAKPYDCLVEAFKSHSIRNLQGEIQEGQQFWVEDCNYGLVLEVFEAFRKFSVLRLGDTFESIPMVEMARRTSPDPSDISETMQYITTLIATGQLSAMLVPEEGTSMPQMIRFLPSSSSSLSEDQIHQDLSLQSLELRNLLKNVWDNDYRLEISKEYVETLRRMKRQKEHEGKEGKDRDPFATQDFEDEDIMM